MIFSFVCFKIGTFVVWAIPDVSFAIPLWVIILAILLGLLVLAVLSLAMWKVGGPNTNTHTLTPSAPHVNTVIMSHIQLAFLFLFTLCKQTLQASSASVPNEKMYGLNMCLCMCSRKQFLKRSKIALHIYVSASVK